MRIAPHTSAAGGDDATEVTQRAVGAFLQSTMDKCKTDRPTDRSIHAAGEDIIGDSHAEMPLAD
jgi:hypothetical protein